MSVPIWMLLGFAAWTVLLLLFTVGTYRWSRILTARAQLADFRADKIEGEDWYKRAMRAHANCLENLPVFGAIVFALFAAHAGGRMVDGLSFGVLISRILQSLVHVCFIQTSAVIAVRFSLFCVQAVSFLALIVIIALVAGPAS